MFDHSPGRAPVHARAAISCRFTRRRFVVFGPGQVDDPTRPGVHVETIGQDQSARIWDGLVAGGYLNAAGDILDKFDPKNPLFKLKVAPEFTDLTAAITDEINRKVFRNRIVNARDRRESNLPSSLFASRPTCCSHAGRRRIKYFVFPGAYDMPPFVPRSV